MFIKIEIHWSWYIIWAVFLGLTALWWQKAGPWAGIAMFSFSGVTIIVAGKLDEWVKKHWDIE